MRYIFDKDYSNVVMCNGYFEYSNQNCCNTTALLERYRYMVRSNEIDENVSLYYNKAIAKSIMPVRASIGKQSDKIIDASSRALINKRRQTVVYQTNKAIITMINDGITYLNKDDKLGDVIRIIIQTKYIIGKHSDSNTSLELARSLLKKDNLDSRTYNKYLRYSIAKLDEYLFSNKNPELNLLIGYIDSVIKAKAYESALCPKGVFLDNTFDFNVRVVALKKFLKKKWKNLISEHQSYRNKLQLADSMMLEPETQNQIINDYVTSYYIVAELVIALEKINIFNCGYDMGTFLNCIYLNPSVSDLAHRINKQTIYRSFEAKLPETTKYRNCKESIQSLAKIIWNEKDSNDYLTQYIFNN